MCSVGGKYHTNIIFLTSFFVNAFRPSFSINYKDWTLTMWISSQNSAFGLMSHAHMIIPQILYFILPNFKYCFKLNVNIYQFIYFYIKGFGLLWLIEQTWINKVLMNTGGYLFKKPLVCYLPSVLRTFFFFLSCFLSFHQVWIQNWSWIANQPTSLNFVAIRMVTSLFQLLNLTQLNW